MNITGLDQLKNSSRTHISVFLTRALTLTSTQQLGIGFCSLLCIFTFNTIMLLSTKYQPSSEGGNRSPPVMPAKSKIASRGPQNCRWGLERCLPIGFGAPINFCKISFLIWALLLWEKVAMEEKKCRKAEYVQCHVRFVNVQVPCPPPPLYM